MNDFRSLAADVTSHRGGECHRLVGELLDALITRDLGHFVNAESDVEMHRLQGAVRRLQELRKLISLTA